MASIIHQQLRVGIIAETRFNAEKACRLGDDFVRGGAGRDSLTGNAGADSFFFGEVHDEDGSVGYESGVGKGNRDRIIDFNRADGDKIDVGAPMISGAQVVGEVVEQRRAAKVITIKKKPRNTYRRKIGHRQHETVVKIVDVLPKGGASDKKAAKKAAE